MQPMYAQPMYAQQSAQPVYVVQQTDPATVYQQPVYVQSGGQVAQGGPATHAMTPGDLK